MCSEVGWASSCASSVRRDWATGAEACTSSQVHGSGALGGGTSIVCPFENRLARAVRPLLVDSRLYLLVSIQVACILIQHVRQNVLRVLQTLHHFQVGRLHRRVERISAPLATFVDVGDHLGLRTQHDFGVILEVHLDHFVGQAEHDGVARSHPFLNVDDVLNATGLLLNLIGHLSVRVWLLSAF